MSGSEPANKVRPSEADERLLIEAAQRDVARFAEIYESYFDLVYAYVVRRVHDRGATEDLTAEVFHKALRSLPKFKWTGAPFATWLFRIASNLIADRAKQERREHSVSLEGGGSDSLPQSMSRDVAFETDVQAGSKLTLQRELEQSERCARLFRTINDLAEDQQRVLKLRFADDKSIHEIANELGRSEGAIKQLQFRALQNLRVRHSDES